MKRSAELLKMMDGKEAFPGMPNPAQLRQTPSGGAPNDIYTEFGNPETIEAVQKTFDPKVTPLKDLFELLKNLFQGDKKSERLFRKYKGKYIDYNTRTGEYSVNGQVFSNEEAAKDFIDFGKNPGQEIKNRGYDDLARRYVEEAGLEP